MSSQRTIGARTPFISRRDLKIFGAILASVAVFAFIIACVGMSVNADYEQMSKVAARSEGVLITDSIKSGYEDDGSRTYTAKVRFGDDVRECVFPDAAKMLCELD